MKNKLYLIISLTLVLAIAIYFTYRYFASTATPISINEISPTGTISLSLGESAQALKVGTATTIPIRIDTGTTKATAVTVDLTYPTTKLQVISVQQGAFFTGVPLQAATISNGRVKFTYNVEPSTGGKQGTGVVAILNVKPILTGSFTLQFAASTLASGIGSNVNLLKSAPSKTYTVTTTTTASPSPSSSSAASPSPSPATQTCPTSHRADINQDCRVNLLDYNLFVINYGNTY